MFFLLAIAAMLGYSLYGTLITHHVRKHDSLSVSTTRGLSLIISMSPLLLLASPENFSLIPLYWTKIIVSGFTGAISLVLSFKALSFLPLGIKTALGRVSSVFFVFLMSWFWFQETPKMIQVYWIIPVVIGGILLASQKIKLDHLDSRTGVGAGLTLLSSILVSLSFVQMSDISRDLDPFISGYAWETSIALWLLMFGVIRWIFCGKTLFGNIKLQEAGKIALVSVPTLIGTGCFAFAVTIGPVGIANVIGTGGIFISILMGHWLYHEKLTKKQWLWILVCVLGLIGLGLSK